MLSHTRHQPHQRQFDFARRTEPAELDEPGGASLPPIVGSATARLAQAPRSGSTGSDRGSHEAMHHCAPQ